MEKHGKTDYNELISEVINQLGNIKTLTEQSNALQKAASADQKVDPRCPAPANITQVGGYINLMLKMQKKKMIQEELLQKTLESIIGLKS